ncbi:GPW/gp25 family protein [Cellvibrio sp. PSBB006]|uniref:GPW/gp25 family protein n=1 Tax=Cellvibrio sp. PSBB006 TaxID=1987723 RepID=UPI000B3B999F|nr:GPW/gp25 family protein [Cellvibrio sp. PSBB006]ARU26578.1 hypothetical protein CBR65_03585 [Cellvibrio sp. PSBB006]
MPSVISFPLSGFDSKRLPWSTGNQSVREVIWNILLTQPGERLMRPEFGAGLKQFIHKPNNETTRRLMADIALKAVQRWEPRIDILELTVSTEPAQLNKVILSLRYRIRMTAEEDNLELGLQLS